MNRTAVSLREKWVLGLVFTWSCLVFLHYFSIRSFFDFSFIRVFLKNTDFIDAGKVLANWFFFLKVCLLSGMALFTLQRFGRRMVSLFNFDFGNFAVKWSLEMGLAILFFNAIWMGLGLNNLWFRPLFLPLGLGLFGVALWDAYGQYKSFQKFPRINWPKGGDRFLACVGLLFFVFSLGQALAPETYYDGLVYHLATLQFWMDRHGMANFSTNLYAHFPFGAELYFLNGFFFLGGEAAKAMNAVLALLLGLTCAGWAAEEAGDKAGWLAWLMVWAFPLVSTTAWDSRNDVALAFFLILFFRSLSRWVFQNEGWKSALESGLWAGGALSVKYTAVVGIAAALGAVLLTRGRFLKKCPWRKGFFFFLVAGLLVFPWVLRNWVFTGNGFYPYFSRWFGGLSLSPENMKNLLADHQAAFHNGESLWAWGRSVLWKDLDKTVGPLFFSFLAYFFLPGDRRKSTKFLMVLSGLFLLGGFLVSHLLRLSLPAFVLFFILAARVLGEIKSPRARSMATATLWVFSFWSFLSLARVAVEYHRVQEMWLGEKTRDEYLTDSPQTGDYFQLASTLRFLPPGDRILVAGDARGLYYPRPFWTNSVFDDPVLAQWARKAVNGAGVAEGLREMGVRDLVVSGLEGNRVTALYGGYDLTESQWSSLHEFIENYTDLIYFNPPRGIYRLREGPAPPRPSFPNLLLVFRKPS